MVLWGKELVQVLDRGLELLCEERFMETLLSSLGTRQPQTVKQGG